MILILGGTTEGRNAVSVCDEAGKCYFYSTKSDSQDIESPYVVRISGGMNESQMKCFCEEKKIRLIINAAHPFAENLHQTVAEVSESLNLPVIRYERVYPERDKDLLWFDSYSDAMIYLEENRINHLLVLTGVNTISKLKPYWETHDCWFRILDRKDSIEIAKQQQFPLSQLLFYNSKGDESALFSQLHPEAILTKESGESGGFSEKILAAKRLGIPVLVVKKPPVSSSFLSVYGKHGLRKAIERLMPDFFSLKTGYTTGVCATAATKAALQALLTQENQCESTIHLPDGELVTIPISSTVIGEESASCSVVKDAGDDPDITNGQIITSTVSLNPDYDGIRFLPGKGVGIVTLPGLGIPVGEPAINKIPRAMIAREVSVVGGLDVTISVPNGEEIAKKTFNPKLGIEGGISIIGTSGIVKPFSTEAFLGSIRREMEVAKALDCKCLVINSGAKSERLIKERYPDLPLQAFIHYGNFIGKTLEMASELHFEKVVLGVMIGKAVKLAEGHWDTHSKKTTMNKSFLMKLAQEVSCSQSVVSAIGEINLARQLWEIVLEPKFFQLLQTRCYEVCKPLFADGELEIILIEER